MSRRRAPSPPERAIQRRRKYGNRMTTYNGQVYDSALEAEVARTLDMLQRARKVVIWHRQVPWELVPADRKKRKRAIVYYADFFVCRAGIVETPKVVIEVKGVETAVWRLKRRLFEWRYPGVPLIVVKRVEDVAAALAEGVV